MGRRITIYMIDGTEFGPRTAEIGNWSGKAIYSPRASISKILDRDEFHSPAVYFLQSQSDSGNFTDSIYIGETENLKQRMKDHMSKRDFNNFVAFVNRDKSMTKGHIKYLESRLIDLSKEAMSSHVENINSSALSRLHEADISDMEYFLEQIKLVLPLMGFRCLVPTVLRSSDKMQLSFETEKVQIVYNIIGRGITAQMYESDQGYVVMKGSQCRKETAKSLAHGWLKLRGNLFHKGILEEKSQCLEFNQDTIFNSSSAAASVVRGKQSAGPVSWKDKNGSTLKENQDTN